MGWASTTSSSTDKQIDMVDCGARLSFWRRRELADLAGLANNSFLPAKL